MIKGVEGEVSVKEVGGWVWDGKGKKTIVGIVVVVVIVIVVVAAVLKEWWNKAVCFSGKDSRKKISKRTNISSWIHFITFLYAVAWLTLININMCLLIGPPGVGKTLLMKRMQSILWDSLLLPTVLCCCLGARAFVFLLLIRCVLYVCVLW